MLVENHKKSKAYFDTKKKKNMQLKSEVTLEKALITSIICFCGAYFFFFEEENNATKKIWKKSNIYNEIHEVVTSQKFGF